jgi:hypothetical protein
MRPFALGLTTALFMAALASFAAPSAARADAPSRAQIEEYHKKGMANAPALAAAAGIDCTVTDAREVGEGVDSKDKAKETFYEVACQQGLGYVLIAKEKAPTPLAYDCVVTSAKGADGKPNSLACTLPGNATPYIGLTPIMAKAGRPCTPSNVRYIGMTPDRATVVYEIACGNGSGYILTRSANGANPPSALPCVAYESSGSTKCKLTDTAKQLALVDTLAAASGKPCVVKDKRYVATTANGTDYYEAGCSDGKGYMFEAAADGSLKTTIPCTQASQVLGGCTLTDTRVAQTEELSLYSSLAKKAGFDCDVSKYADFPTSDNNTEIVEMACSNRSDGGVGIFPAAANAKPEVLNCLRAEAEGYHCSFTPTSALFDSLSAQLKAKGRGSCVVSAARPFGIYTAADGVHKDDLLEVGCADGGPGLVLVYAYGSQVPSQFENCAQVAKENGGCQLPNNKPKS